MIRSRDEIGVSAYYPSDKIRCKTHAYYNIVTSLSPLVAPVQGRLQGPLVKSKFLAVRKTATKKELGNAGRESTLRVHGIHAKVTELGKIPRRSGAV
ncbi:hypothetical protein N9291_01040, partial [bacterium]|nr:hypothetical protein [bacterium]